MTMNIIFYYQLNILPEKGGTERATYALAHELKRRNYRCIFLAHTRHDGSSIRREPAEFPQLYLPNSSVLDCPENEAFIRTLCVKEKTDIIINQDVMNRDTSFLSKTRFPGIKFVGVCHFSLYGGITFFEDHFKQCYILGKTSLIKYLAQRFLTPLYKIKLRKSNHNFLKQIYNQNNRIVLMSEQEKSYYPVTDYSIIDYIPNPLTLRKKHNHPKEKLILIVSRLVYMHKRIDYFLRAWKKIWKKFPDWKVNILGAGECEKYYREFVKKHNLQNIEFCGNVEPDAFYARASILCSTSTNEGFGLTLTEGMVYGCVPIAFNSFSTARDIIDHMIDGILVTPFNLDEYSDQLQLLMSDNTLRESMSKHAEEKAKKFSAHHIGEKWDNLLTNI